MRKLSLLAGIASLAALLAIEPGNAADFTKGDIRIARPWSRATPQGAKVAAGYLTVTNNGKTADRLVGGSALVAGVLEIHDMTMVDGVMRMRHLEKGIEVKAGETITLKPGGFHLMMMDLKGAVKQGDKIKGTLIFEKAGSIEIEYEVAPIGATSPDAAARAGSQESHKGH